MTELSGLEAGRNRISDLSALSVFSHPPDLGLEENLIEDLSVFEEMSRENKWYVFLSGNQISDISAFDGVVFGILDLSNNNIEDISPLWNSMGERTMRLYLNGNRIKDISVLANMGDAPVEVMLWDNLIEDISPLVNTSFNRENSELYLSGNRISDLSPLAEFDRIFILSIEDNNVSDLRPLAAIDVREIYAANNQIHDLWPLLDNSKSAPEWLELTNNKVVDISAIAAIGRRDYLELPRYLILHGNPLGEKALSEDLPFLCDINLTQVFYGDGEMCEWMDSSLILPDYNYPPEPYDGPETPRPEMCSELPGWLSENSLPGTAHSGADFSLDETVSDEPTVQDLITGLTWRRCSEGQMYTGGDCTGDASDHEDAESYAAICNGSYGGYDDWRLPTPSELASLVDFSIHYPGPTIDTDLFPGTYIGSYLTSASPLYQVNFYNGELKGGGSGTKIRCVRGGNDATVDGRFEANGDAVIDKWTGLEWQRCAVGQTFDSDVCTGIGTLLSWAEAESSCAGEWRVPSVIELGSIVNPCGLDPAAFSSVFPNTPPALFWSSTVFPDEDEKRWSVYFVTGWTDPLLLSDKARVRCVR